MFAFKKPDIYHLAESGALPINLECRYPGQWFQVKKTEVQTPTGHWNPVSMETTADKQCKQTKKASGKNFACEVAKFSNLGRVRQVRITYYCWEFGKLGLVQNRSSHDMSRT